jgi:hypothetical protein
VACLQTGCFIADSKMKILPQRYRESARDSFAKPGELPGLTDRSLLLCLTWPCSLPVACLLFSAQLLLPFGSDEAGTTFEAVTIHVVVEDQTEAILHPDLLRSFRFACRRLTFA